MLYPALKHLHMTCALLSFTLFALRGMWMLQENPLLQKRVVRILPHVIDTFLLLSAVGLMFVVNQYPFVHDWLTVKLFALIAYIVLGNVALKRGPTVAIRAGAWAAALLLFIFIASVALTHHPLGLLNLFV